MHIYWEHTGGARTDLYVRTNRDHVPHSPSVAYNIGFNFGEGYKMKIGF